MAYSNGPARNGRGHGENRLLAALAPDDMTALLPHLEVVDLPLGRVLYEAGEPLTQGYFFHDSIASQVAVMADGGVAEMATIGREGVLDLVTLLGGGEAFGRFTVQLPGSASRIPVNRLIEVCQTNPNVERMLLRFTQASLHQALQLVACNALHPVEARCCRWILMTHDRVDRANFPLTHEFLAQMLGVHRPTVSVVARTLQTAGLIATRRGAITVTDRAGLEESACECYGVIRRAFTRLLPGTYN